MNSLRRSSRKIGRREEILLSAALLFLLSGCGTLKIDIEYGWTPAAAGTESVPTGPAPTDTAAPGPTALTSPTPTPSVAPTDMPTAVPPLRPVDISAGDRHTCVVTNRGGVQCWGSNEKGQLGNGTMVDSNVPVDVRGVQDAVSVKAGWKHTCALTRLGAVMCWGYNRNGELGNGKTADSSIPVGVVGLSSGVVSIGMGDDHTCAVLSGGAVKCWGYNEYGQLGDGTKTSRSVAMEVKGLASTAVAAAGGWGHTCVLNSAGGIRCWGNNEEGQLGYGQSVPYRFTAVAVTDLESGVIGLGAGGGHACALLAGGGIRCWGNNKYGQLGDGTAEIRGVPVAVDGIAQGAVKAAAGWNHTCAVMANGELKCWGWNFYGQLGDATKATQTRPVNVRRMMEDATDAAPGWAHTCALTAAGGVKCWGWNQYGQLGDGTNLDSVVPLTVTGWGGSAVP
jgi:alpha-tubulin suppressor-like RCC1 family protein